MGHILAQVFGINDDPAAAVVIDHPVDGRIEEVDQGSFAGEGEILR